MNAPQTLKRWSEAGSSRVPFWAYTDSQLYQRELDRIFYGEHWSYVGLEIEVPNIGDFKLTFVGERQVILVRDRVAPKDRGIDSGIRVVENRCAHRGVRFCQQPHGNARSFVCPYHQWTYKLNGDLAGLPFKDGVKAVDADGVECVNGGMPAEFDLFCEQRSARFAIVRAFAGELRADLLHEFLSGAQYLSVHGSLLCVQGLNDGGGQRFPF